MKAMGLGVEVLECLMKSRECRKECKGVVVQKNKRGRTCDCVVRHASSFVFDSFRNTVHVVRCLQGVGCEREGQVGRKT